MDSPAMLAVAIITIGALVFLRYLITTAFRRLKRLWSTPQSVQWHDTETAGDGLIRWSDVQLIRSYHGLPPVQPAPPVGRAKVVSRDGEK